MEEQVQGADDTGKDFNDVTISNTTLPVQLSSSEMEIDGTITIDASAVFYLNGVAFDLNGVLSNNGTFRLEGGEDVAFGTQDTDSGTWEYVGDGAGAATTHNVKDFGVNDYYNLTINDTSGSNSDTFRLTSGLDVENDLNITDAVLDASTNSIDITIEGIGRKR